MTLVTSTADMAAMLFRASALHAPVYALAAHEKACEAGDDARTQFWLGVCRDLETLCAEDARKVA